MYNDDLRLRLLRSLNDNLLRHGLLDYLLGHSWLDYIRHSRHHVNRLVHLGSIWLISHNLVGWEHGRRLRHSRFARVLVMVDELGGGLVR